MHQQMLEQLTAIKAIERSPEVLSGVWRFRGTRVPVSALFENLRDGATVAEFLTWFPGVTKAQKAQVDEILACEIHALRDKICRVDGEPPSASLP